LDEIAEGGDHFQDKTTALINIEISNDSIVTNTPWARHRELSPNILFTSKLESDETTELFGNYDHKFFLST
jgi:hypothetical protein